MKTSKIIGLGILTGFLFITLYNNWFYSLIDILIAPLFLICLFLFALSLYLLIFNQAIQQAWWRWARFGLVVPFAVIVLMLPTYQNGGGFVTFGGTTDLVILWGVIFAAATLIYTLYQRWYRKTGI